MLRSTVWKRSFGLLLLGPVFVAGCAAEISGKQAPGTSPTAMIGSGGSEAGSGGSSASATGGAGQGPVVAAPGEELPSPSSRVPRLSHQQWVNSVNDLLEITTASDYAKNFRTDPRQGGFLFDNDTGSFVVDQALWKSYQDAAESLAAYVVSDDARLAKILPANPGTVAAQAQAFIEAFGARAFRRPLTPAEAAEYKALYDTAPGAYADVADPLKSGVRLLLEAFLQAPDFLYRVETSSSAQGKIIPLNSYEVASRLSYALSNSMPDAALLQAAAAGLDATAVSSEARRLLGDPRAASVLNAFGIALFDQQRISTINPSTTTFPDAPKSLAALAVEENSRFLTHALFDKAGSFSDLMTATETVVNADLAKLYGLSGTFTSEFVPATLNPAERSGILTQIGFLASRATSQNPDPIHRGVFIANRLLCQNITAPPIAIPPLPAAGAKTNRQNVADHTEVPGSACVGCHSLIINPLGFPFENYDAVGAYRTQDNGVAVDAQSTATIGTQQVAVNNALELTQAIAQSPEAHACFSGHLVEYLLGRQSAPLDQAVIEHLRDNSLKKATVKDLILQITQSPTFRARSVQELP
ncbi:MAG: DUF1592 domain-containing protein [Polyangiaceae bacterium]|nr:DUF1592 domain-containing protein [Polyangiaceae bacterium]